MGRIHCLVTEICCSVQQRSPRTVFANPNFDSVRKCACFCYRFFPKIPFCVRISCIYIQIWAFSSLLIKLLNLALNFQQRVSDPNHSSLASASEQTVCILSSMLFVIWQLSAACRIPCCCSLDSFAPRRIFASVLVVRESLVPDE